MFHVPVVPYAAQVAEYSCDGIFGSEQIHSLYIECLFSTCGYEVYFTTSEDADRHLESLRNKVVKDDILHHFLDTATQIKPAKQVAQAVIRKIVFIVLLNHRSREYS